MGKERDREKLWIAGRGMGEEEERGRRRARVGKG